MNKPLLATGTAAVALAAALVVTNLPRPTLIQLSQFALMFNAPDAELDQRSEWDWTMKATIPGTDSTATLRMTVCEQRVELPPPASGASIEDGQLVLRGDFGLRGTTFDSNPDLSALATGATASQWGGGWRNGLSSAIQPAVRARADGSRYVHAECANGGYNSGMAVEFAPARIVHACWRVKFRPRTGGNGNPQWKVWRLNSTINYNQAFNNFRGEMMASGNFTPGGWTRNLLYAHCWPMLPSSYPARCIAYEDGGGALACEAEYQHSYPNDANRWVRWEINARHSSSPGVRDGDLAIGWRLPAEGGQPGATWSGGLQNLVTAEAGAAWSDAIPCKASRFVWQNYFGEGGPEAIWEFEDLHVQTGSWARVELGDAAAYTACTDLRPLIVTSWEPGEIRCKVRPELYGSVWIYVTLADGSRLAAMAL